MKYLLKGIDLFYKRIIGSIAFYPILISLGFIILAIVMLSIENSDICIKIKENISYLLIKDIDTARTMLSTLIGGIFSLTVFSFSMVMVVLNQASSNFSPRLLPGLISNKKHQIILGSYIGTLLYSLIVLMNIKSFEAVEDSIGLSILLGVFFGVSCTGLFVYFIHTISQEIQIQNIVSRIFKTSLKTIESKIELQKKSKSILDFNNEGINFEIKSEKTGYYEGFSKDLLSNALDNYDDIHIEIIPQTNKYIKEGDVLIKSNKQIDDDKREDLLFSLSILPSMHVDKGYTSNMIKLMEVAIRAMSPGINDPGTAVDVINKLGLLLKKAFELKSHTYLEKDNFAVLYHDIDYKEIMRLVFQPLRQYSKNDSVVMYKLIDTLNYVNNSDTITLDAKKAVNSELKSLEDDAKESIFNKDDLNIILNIK
ncbi:DUF2254 domain-containing protein [uncultured Winogradskyella sp.]|uniref:DUF2254 domain-containing protein n=1 Tax=uncultured Winogradskyella sp. TaxID=395353 RepID=UPI002605A6E0|nr:DUF2254 domain-containing protein [uncultured Winogradskyella sp.]